MLKGKSAIVTGSTSGIGLGIAQALAGAGVNVMLNGFGEAAQIEATRASLADATGTAVAYSAADMSRADQVADMVRQAESQFGAVDILVNNAGIQFVSSVEEFPDEKWEQILAINLSSNFYAIKGGLRRKVLVVVVVVDYDNFGVLPDVHDMYWDTVKDLSQRFHSNTIRYTTSAFMRAKLGAALGQRGLSPHVFESAAESSPSATPLVKN